MTRSTPLRLAALVGAVAVALVLATSSIARPAAGPTNTADPTITGIALVGSVLEASPGTWTPQVGITFKYRWLRCNPAGGDDSSDRTCTTIADADRRTYTVASADSGRRIRVRVIASTKGGTTQATSAATSVVGTEGGRPASQSPPTISGSTIVGSKLTGTPGSWVGSGPITTSYLWHRCDEDGNGCVPLSGRTSLTYTIVQADLNRTLRLRVEARNTLGRSDAYSTATDVVRANPDDGIITLPNGDRSVDVKDVPRDHRLIVDRVNFFPNPVTSRETPITVRIRVKDTRGNVVRNAVVFIRSTPILTSGGDDARTAIDGWVQYTLLPRADFPLRTGFNVQFFVRAYRIGDPGLAGVSGSRLVQVATRG
jgi:hypothetical protein